MPFSQRFMVREFIYNEEELTAGKNELSKLLNDKKKYFVSFSNVLKYHIGAVFAILLCDKCKCFSSQLSEMFCYLYFAGSSGSLAEGKLQ